MAASVSASRFRESINNDKEFQATLSFNNATLSSEELTHCEGAETLSEPVAMQ